MKKIILMAAGFLLMGAVLHADEWRTWRSTEIAGATAEELCVATGNIIVNDITVTSGSVGGSATFQIATATGVTNVLRSTSTIKYDTDTSGTTYELLESLPYGFYYQTTGNSFIRVRWNWTRSVPPGKAAVGLKP